MRLTELLLFGVVGWSGIGLVGVLVARRRGESQRAVRGVRWMAAVLVAYGSILLGVSLAQRQRVLPVGAPQCFGEMCFTVAKVEDLPGFLMRDRRRLLRVSVQVSNQGDAMRSDESIRAYLVDGRGREWNQSAGVGGVALNVRVGSRQTVVSQPVFEVAEDAKSLRLVFTHGWKWPGRLVIGDPESLLHRRTEVDLGR